MSRPRPDHDYVKVTSIHKPSLTPFLPESANATGAAVIICPGGAHAFLAWDIEGVNVAQWLAAHGIAGFALQYRLARETNSPYQVEVHALQDTQRAIRLVRSRAQEWGLSPQRIGVMGFSAGGQLAALAANRFDNGLTNAADAVDRVSCRPDFQALLYPAIPRAMTFSKETTPPAFLVCGYEDRTNISEGLPELYLQLKRAGVPAELHVYSGTGHGFGLRPSQSRARRRVAAAVCGVGRPQWFLEEAIIRPSEPGYFMLGMKCRQSGAPTCSRLYGRNDAESRLKIGAPNTKGNIRVKLRHLSDWVRWLWRRPRWRRPGRFSVPAR